MSTFDRPPASSGQQTHPVNRHHSARYYAHRVQESLTTRVSKVICGTVISMVFILGVIAFILWLSLRPHRPRFYIRGFSIPGLAQPNGFENAQIIFNVTARNPNQHIGFNYSTMQASVFYRDQKIGSAPLVDSFHQDPKTTTIFSEVFSGATLTVNSQRWMAFMDDRGKGMVMFRLEIAAIIRFKVSTWYSKHHTMHANCDVAVGPNGSILDTFKDKRCPVYFSN